VCPEQAGAHLEVYIATLSVINTLRLCNRYGTGATCYINKVPTELISAVEEYLVESAREKALKTWSQERKCCEGICQELEHYDHTQEELYQLYHSYYGCLDEACSPKDTRDHEEWGHGTCGGDKCPAWKFNPEADSEVRKKLHKHSNLDFDETYGRCSDLQNNWTLKVNADSGFFKQEQEVLKKHFGINVWTANLRPDDMNDEFHTSVAYLTLLSNILRPQKWESPYYQVNDTGYGMPVNIGAPPTKQSLSRFPRALKILGLQAWTHPLLEGQPILSLPAAGITESTVDDKDMAQPQLTFLVRCQVERIP
jgi:hypothetical protein